MNKRKIYIWLFGLLYASTAFVSTFHAISFFELANTIFLGIVLAITFEIGQAAVLFSILTDTKERKRYMPWVLMTILTLVQIMGNVFASYKGLCSGDPANLTFFKEPMLFWADLDDKMCNIVLAYVTGAILPIVALCMTGMLTNYLSDKDKDLDAPLDLSSNSQVNNEKTYSERMEEIHNEMNNQKEPEKDIEDYIEEAKQAEADDILKQISVPVTEEDEIKEETEKEKEPEKDIEDEIKEENEVRNENSHFVNLSE